MAKELVDMKERLNEYKYMYSIKQKIPCTKEENRVYREMVKEGRILPKGVYHYKYETGIASDDFYTEYDPELSHEQIMEYLAYKKLDLLHTIKKCVMFFTVLTVIGLIICFLWGFFAQ